MNKSCEKCRSKGEKLLLKGDRCTGPGCSMIKKPQAPGVRSGGDSRPSKKSEFGRQLLEKQKARAIYGLREKQFRSYVLKSEKLSGNKAENVLKLLELRLDNVVYRLHLALSRAHARQMVSHGLIVVNGRKVSIPSYLIKEGDLIEPKRKEGYADLKSDGVPAWLELNPKKVNGIVKHIPIREEIDSPINENMIIEYYSR